MAKTHVAHGELVNRTACGMPIESPSWKGGRLPIADDVTALLALTRRHRCADCLAILARALEGGLAEASAPESTEAPFVPDSRSLRPEEVTQRMRARTLSRAGQRAIERSVRGEPLERGWASAEAALRAWMLSSPPSPMRSSSDFGARVQASRDPSLGGAAHAAIDRHRNASLAWQRAFERLLFEPAQIEALAPWMTVERPSWPRPDAIVSVATHAREIAADRVLGRANTEQLAEDETHRWRHPPQTRVTAHQIARIVEHFVGAVRDALVLSGELAMPKGSGVGGGSKDAGGTRSRRFDPLRTLRAERERERAGS